MKKSFWFWLTFALALLMAIYLAVRVSVILMGQGGTISDIKKISVYSSNGKVSDIVSRLNITPGTKHVDLGEALNRVISDPDVANAGVRRTPNGEIKVRVKMRVVVASWTDGENYYPLDNTGAPINRPSPDRPENTLVFAGTVPNDITDVLETLKHAPGLFYRIDRIEFIEDRRWDVFLLNGIRIMLPEENFAEAIKKIEKMNKQNMILDRQIKLLDFRDIARPLIKTGQVKK